MPKILSPVDIESLKRQLTYMECRCRGTGSYWRNPSDSRFEDHQYFCSHEPANINFKAEVENLIATIEHLLEVSERAAKGAGGEF